MALLSSLVNSQPKAKMERFGIIMVHYSKLIPSESNNYSTDNIEELARAILLSGGVKQNLLARKKSPDEYELIAGHRRHLAVKYLVEEMGQEEYAMMPVHVEKDGDIVSEINLILANCSMRERSDWEKMMEVTRLTELMKALQSGTEDQQERFRRLFGKEPSVGGRELRKMVAESLGLSETKVANLRHINSGLVPELKDRFQTGEIGVSVANEAAGLPAEEQMELAKRDRIQLADIKNKSVSESDTDDEQEIILKSESSSFLLRTGDCLQEECRGCTEAQGEEKDGEPLSAYGTPREIYPEDSLIATAGCKGGHSCSSCSMECQLRQAFCYCVEAPLGNPFPCDRIDEIGMLRDAVGDKCQFVNLALAYHRRGDGEPVPCCKACGRQCDFRCDRAKLETELEKDPETGVEETKGGIKVEKPKSYDRGLLEQIIAIEEEIMSLMQDEWSKSGMQHWYTESAMKIQAFKNLLAEHDAAEAEESKLLENPEPSQLELPVLKNEDQRKEWLRNYKAWGLWYRDEHIDVNYYKFDFEDGSRLVVSEFPQRENERSVKKYDQVYYHLIEHEKRKYQSDKVYEDKYQYHSNSVTELVEYLKKIWRKKKG